MSVVRASFFNHDDNRPITVRRWMLDATKDDDGDANLAAAMMLAQITWWLASDTKTGEPRFPHEHAGETWLVRADNEWGCELAISQKLAGRLRRRLTVLGLIECRVFVDDGVRCSHIRRLPFVDEPSTMIPFRANAQDGSGPEHDPVQGVSHARASSFSFKEGEGEANSSANAGTSSKGVRLPEPFALTDAMREWAAKNVPRVDIRDQTERFCDYWRGVPGSKGTKTDWLGTWRNWMKRTNDDITERQQRANGKNPMDLKSPISKEDATPWK